MKLTCKAVPLTNLLEAISNHLYLWRCPLHCFTPSLASTVSICFRLWCSHHVVLCCFEQVLLFSNLIVALALSHFGGSYFSRPTIRWLLFFKTSGVFILFSLFFLLSSSSSFLAIKEWVERIVHIVSYNICYVCALFIVCCLLLCLIFSSSFFLRSLLFFFFMISCFQTLFLTPTLGSLLGSLSSDCPTQVDSVSNPFWFSAFSAASM